MTPVRCPLLGDPDYNPPRNNPPGLSGTGRSGYTPPVALQGVLGARLRGRTATQRSKKGSEKVLGRVLGKGFSEGF